MITFVSQIGLADDITEQEFAVDNQNQTNQEQAIIDDNDQTIAR